MCGKARRYGAGESDEEKEVKTMAEYFEREAAIKAVMAAKWADGSDGAMAMEIVATVPAADVTPVVHGRWENGNPICPVCGEDKFKDLDADIWCDWQSDFCPNCGAKMGESADR